ncbi:MAG: hypothetical protein Q4P13_11995 [Psychrobacter sp.]|nr:hypothetical protein [Psychrobacter sp.]
MADQIYDLGSGFWNIQGSFKLGGVIDIGTQCSLVKLASGKFVFLDSYSLTGDVREQVMALTDNGDNVEAVLNLHPFHTVHCEQMAQDFPKAAFYGSLRHQQKVPNIEWEKALVESETITGRYPELEFSLPQGIYYIAPNEMIHAGSLLAYHPASQSLHVDDTFVTPPGKLLKALLPELALHPTTKKALTDEADAGKQYCDWASKLAHDWRDTRNFCAAHSGVVKFESGEFEKALLAAIDKARPKLEGA